MNWTVLIAAVIAVLMECLENRSRQEVEAGLSRPGFLQRGALRQVLRNTQGLRGRRLRVAMDEGMEYLAAMESDEVAELLDDAERKMTPT